MNKRILVKMRLTQKKIEEILHTILGEDGLPLIKYLTDKENVSEFDLASKTKKDIKIIRKMLYLLYNYNLVSFIRKKDKIKGWYIYYWTLLPESIKYLYFKKKKETLQLLQQQLEEEKKELFFTCPKKCVRLNFDRAMDFEFHCPECGSLFGQDSGVEKVSLLREEIKELEGELKKGEKPAKAKKEKPTAKIKNKAKNKRK